MPTISFTIVSRHRNETALETISRAGWTSKPEIVQDSTPTAMALTDPQDNLQFLSHYGQLWAVGGQGEASNKDQQRPHAFPIPSP